MAIRNLLPDVWRGERDPWNPSREMSRLQRRIDRMFDDFMNEPIRGLIPWSEELEFTPACDVEETPSHFLVSFDLPGMKKDEVKIELRDNQLTIWGERKREEKKEAEGRLSRERYYGNFRRTFQLPANVNADKAEANYENGVLQVAIPKTEVAAAKQIPIKEGKLLEAKGGKAA